MTHTRTVSIFDADKLPILLRTGKVQQNAQNSGEGRWSIPHGGFTSQLKYNGMSGRVRAQLAGYTFHRYTPLDNSIFNANRYAQQPHCWLFELPHGDTENLLQNAQDGTTAGHTAGTSTTMSAVQISNPSDSSYVIKLKRSTGAGTGTVSVQTQGLGITDGSQYMLSGWIYATHGSVTISSGSRTWYPNTTYPDNTNGAWYPVSSLNDDPVTAGADTYIDISCTDIPESGAGYLYVKLFVMPYNLQVRDVWLTNTVGAGYFASTLDELKAKAITQINAASPLTYSLDSHGDIVCESSDYVVMMGGPVPHVCGWGYVPAQDPDGRPAGMAQAEYPGGAHWYSGMRADNFPPSESADLFFESSTGNPDFTRMRAVVVRNKPSGTPNRSIANRDPQRNYIGYTPTPAQLVRNRSAHEYYWQCSMDTRPRQMSSRTIYASGGSVRLRYISTTGSLLQVGDVVQIGAGFATITDEGAATLVNGGRYIEVEGRLYASSSGNVAHVVNGIGDSIAWCRGWAEYYAQHQERVPSGVTISTADPWPLIDASQVTGVQPTAILKQLLGRPAESGEQNAGVPPAYTCTTVADLFGYTTSDRQLIDWPTLADLIRDFDLQGAKYSLDVPREQTDDAAQTEQPQEINILQLLYGVCQTHQIRLIWGYDDAQRSWRITFAPDRADTITDAVLRDVVIRDSSCLVEPPREVTGGGFAYSGIKTEYKCANGGTLKLSINDPSGRIQHRGARKLEIKDSMTILPSQDCDAVDQLTLNFGNRVHVLAQLSHRVKAGLTLNTAGRLAVGAAVVVDLPHVRDPQSGRQEVGERVATVDVLTTTIGARAKVDADLLYSKLQLSGDSPSLYVDTWTRTATAVSVTGLETDTANNVFADPDGGLTDLAMFDCLSYNPDDGVHARSCSCGDYACYIALEGSSTWTPGTTIWTCTIGAVDVAAGTATLTLGTGYAGFPASTSGSRYVLFFASRDNAGLQPCQTDYYGWLGDSAGLVYDSSGTPSKAIQTG
jgi:hypothetical protein